MRRGKPLSKPKWWQFQMKRDWENLDGMASELDLIADEVSDLTVG